MKTSTKLIMFLMLSSPVWANDIYVTQSGNNLVLDITQSGTGNTIGTLNLPSSLTGAGTDFTIVQNGNTPAINIIHHSCAFMSANFFINHTTFIM